MKVFLVLATLVVAVQLAEIPWSDPSASDKYAVHYRSHTDNVAEARRLVSDRLQEYGANDAQFVAASGNDHQQSVGASGAPLCTISCGKGGSASEFVSASDVEQIDQSDVGVGYVGFNEQDAQSEFNHQQIYNEQHQQQYPATAILAVSGGAAGAESEHSSSRHSEHISESGSVAAAPVSILVQTPSAAAGSTYSRNVNHQQTEVKSIPVQTSYYPTVAVGGGGSDSEHFQRHTEQSSSTSSNNNPSYAPIVAVYPTAANSGSNSRYSSRVQQQRYQESRPVSTPVVHVQPIYGGGSSSSDRYTANHVSHTSDSLNTAPVHVITYPAINNGGSESQTTRSERITERKTVAAAPQPTFVVLQSQQPQRTSERYSSHVDQYRNSAAESTLPVHAPVYPIGGVYSNRYASASDRYVDSVLPSVYSVAVPVAAAPARSSSSHLSHYEQSSSAQQQQQQPQATFITYPVTATSAYRSSENHAANSALNVNRHANLLYVPTYADATVGRHQHASYGQRPSTRVGSSQLFSDSHLHSTNLHGLISESERLAREQHSGYASGVAHESASSHASLFENNNNQLGVGSGFNAQLRGNNGAGAGVGADGAFYRTKQWENNEKWSSGSQYDDQGRLRTHSTLSTAEAELHNVNGKSTGYKAATSTVEDDGKISTYSLRT